MEKKYRAAVIGSTGRGGYGHGLDVACTTIENIDIAAVADADPEGLQAAGERLGVEALYPNYRDMLERENPDLVCIGPGWVAERAAMVPTTIAVVPATAVTLAVFRTRFRNAETTP